MGLRGGCVRGGDSNEMNICGRPILRWVHPNVPWLLSHQFCPLFLEINQLDD